MVLFNKCNVVSAERYSKEKFPKEGFSLEKENIQKKESSKGKIKIQRKDSLSKGGWHSEGDNIIPYKPDSMEWFAFKGGWQCDYNVKYDDSAITVLTNILYKESRSFETENKLIDKYLVIMCAIRKTELKYGNNVNKFIAALKSGDCNMFGWRDYFYTPKSGKNWDNCKEVVLNILNGNIPDYVPYVPHGTINYWNSDIDTNTAQRLMLEKKYVIFASTVKQHHFFVKESEMRPEEREYLKSVSCLNNVEKNIDNGYYCR